MKNKLLFIVLLVVFQSCEMFMEHPKKEVIQLHDIEIINKSDLSICYLFSNQYPDTTLFKRNPFTSIEQCTINKDTMKMLQPEEYAINDFYGKAPVNCQYLFIVSKAVLETKTWDSICNNYLILKRYDLTLEYLMKNNWTITYP